MACRIAIALVLTVTAVTASRAQVAPPEPAGGTPPAAWATEPAPGQVTPVRYGEPAPLPNSVSPGAGSYNAASQTPAAAPGRSVSPTTPPKSSEPTPVGAPRVEKATVSKGSGRLPNSAGQVWREYDIRPYTLRVSTEPKPQQRIVDWILRETGYEAWHGETVGMLNATKDKLIVYHTPAMQAIVSGICDRFVNGRGSDRAFSMRIVTVRNPDWRVRALRLMTPIRVQSDGLQGWIMPKENYALLQAELGRRGDVRDYNAANQLIPNGQAIVFSTMRPRGYVKGIIPTGQAWPGYQPEPGQLEEGASLEFNPLLSMDLQTAEAVVKLRMTQVEKMRQVSLDLPAPAVPGGSTSGQRLQVEVPQVTMANLHERFRWPANQVLVLSMGMVATPGPEQGNSFTEMLPDMMKSPPRADALLFVEARDARTPVAPGAPGGVSTAGRPTTFGGRY